MKTFIFLAFLIGLFGISEPNERHKRFFGETFGHLLNGATSAFGSVIEKVFPGSGKLSNSKPAEILSSIVGTLLNILNKILDIVTTILGGLLETAGVSGKNGLLDQLLKNGGALDTLFKALDGVLDTAGIFIK